MAAALVASLDSMRTGVSDELFEQLARHAQLPRDQAVALPPAAYTDPAVLQLERERVFASQWLCVGRTADVPNPGDYRTSEVASPHDDSLLGVVMVRDEQGVVRVFANVCAHRCATLVVGSGHAPRFTCPYHAWVYRLDGQCIAAPYMHQSVEPDGRPFDPANHGLRPLATEVWEGFVFVSQAADPGPLAPRLGGLLDIVGRYEMAGYMPVADGTEVWDTNWKCLAENFLDAYHVFKVHKNTFAKESDSTGSTTVYPGGEGYTYHVAVDDPASSYGVAHPDNQSLTDTWRHSTVLAATYPTHVVQLQPDWLWYLVLSPVGVRRDVQGEAKKMGRPWEMGKSFDESAPMTALKAAADIGHPAKGAIWLKINGEFRQQGDLAMQIWNVQEQISYLSNLVTLEPGDLIMTGTPAGVGPVKKGDRLEGHVDGVGDLSITYAA